MSEECEDEECGDGEEGNFLTLIFEVSKNKQTPSSSSGVLDFVGCTRLAVTVSPH